MDYSSRLGNRTVPKRLGYLVETLEIEAPEIVEHCRKTMSPGYSKLDPSTDAKGRFLRRWNLQVNVKLADGRHEK